MYHQIFALIINQVQFLALVYKYSSSVFTFKSALGVKKMKAFHKDFFPSLWSAATLTLKFCSVHQNRWAINARGEKPTETL